MARRDSHRLSRLNRIEICGGIASGKTTLAALLRRVLLYPIMEDFRRNPFLTDFYSDPRTYALETELSFLLQHYHAVKRFQQPRMAVCDFSFHLDLAYANCTLNRRERQNFGYLYEVLTTHLGKAPVLIYLRCPPEVELKRIRARGRDREMSISLGYLAGLDRALRKVVCSLRGTRILELDSHALNFTPRGKNRSEALEAVKRFLKQR